MSQISHIQVPHLNIEASMNRRDTIQNLNFCIAGPAELVFNSCAESITGEANQKHNSPGGHLEIPISQRKTDTLIFLC